MITLGAALSSRYSSPAFIDAEAWQREKEAAFEALAKVRIRLNQLEHFSQSLKGPDAHPIPMQATVRGGPMDGQMIDAQGPHLQWRDEQLQPCSDDPHRAQVITVAWLHHLYSDGTYRLEAVGHCPAEPAENPPSGG